MSHRTLTEWLETRANSTEYGYIVQQNGRILSEHYGGGAGPDSRWDIGSIRKSFHSALVGQLIESGHLSPDMPACEKWPRLVELSGREEDRAITLHHLLGATSGWLAPESPGEKFRYNNAAFTAAERVTTAVLPSHDVPAEIKTRFAQPLGLRSFTAHHRDVDFDPERFGNPGPKMIVACNVRDLLCWGELWRNGGSWQGQQLIPENYAKRATRLSNPHLPGAHYGYCWRLNAGRHVWPGAPDDTFGHSGNGFNLNGPEPVPGRAFLFICPGLNLVAAVCLDPCVGVATDYNQVPMPHTNAWIEQVLKTLG